MPKRPKGEKRPADVIANAVHVMQIATGEAEETYEGQTDDGKDKAAQALGNKGGAARAARMTPERRAEIARVRIRYRSQKMTAATRATADRKRSPQRV